MGADNNVHQSLLQICYGLLLLRRCFKTAEQVHTDRKILHSLDKSVVVLLCQNGCGDKIHYLFALLHGFESCPDGDLCLAVSHVAADQAVHDLPALHIVFCSINGI